MRSRMSDLSGDLMVLSSDSEEEREEEEEEERPLPWVYLLLIYGVLASGLFLLLFWLLLLFPPYVLSLFLC